MHRRFREKWGGEEPGTKPSVHVELEAHRRATPFFAGTYFYGGVLAVLMNTTVMIHVISGSLIYWYGIHV